MYAKEIYMLKVIKLDKHIFNIKKKENNNIIDINNNLALSLNFTTINRIPKRRAFRSFIIKETEKGNKKLSVSNKDIKRMECPWKFEIPTNIVSILETIIINVIGNKDSFRYRADDDDKKIVSDFALLHTIEQVRVFIAYINTHDLELNPTVAKYKDEIEYVSKEFQEFDKKYNYIFNKLFED